MNEHDNQIFSEIASRFEMRGERLQEYEDITDLATKLQSGVTEIETEIGLPSAQTRDEEMELLELMRRATYGELGADQIDLDDQLIVSGAGFITCAATDRDVANVNHLVPEVRVHGAVADIDVMEVPRYHGRLGAFFNLMNPIDKDRRASVVLELKDASLEYLAGSENPYFLSLASYKRVYIPLVYTEADLRLRRRIEY